MTFVLAAAAGNTRSAAVQAEKAGVKTAPRPCSFSSVLLVLKDFR